MNHSICIACLSVVDALDAIATESAAALAPESGVFPRVVRESERGRQKATFLFPVKC